MASELHTDWDYYFCTVNGVPSSILVDLAAIARAPVAGKPWLLWVRVHLLSPQENGFPGNEEAPRLYAIEDSLDEKLSEAIDAEPAGRITGGQRRECYFYASSPAGFERAVAEIQELFAEYSIECGASHDPKWRHYRDLLYPSAANLRRIHTRRLVSQLLRHGDDHDIPRPVDHALHFRSVTDRRGFTALAGRAGFKVRLENNKGADGRPCFVNVVRADPVGLEHIAEVVEQLVEWAERFDGEYEGWGCPICTDETPHS